MGPLPESVLINELANNPDKECGCKGGGEAHALVTRRAYHREVGGPCLSPPSAARPPLHAVGPAIGPA